MALDTAISNKDVRRLQAIEDSLLTKAKDEFEFISPHEFTDLERLKDDRNLCAHPAFVGEDSLFEPERVRLHIVHAIKILLQHQPVQGKTALSRIVNDLKSVSFPSDLASVQTYLNSKYLDRAKKALIENLVTLLVKAILRGDLPDLPLTYFTQISLSLTAVSRRHPQVYEESLSAKLPSQTESLEDSKVSNVYRLLGIDTRCWQWVGEPTRIRLKSGIEYFVSQSSTRGFVFAAVSVNELKGELISTFNSLDQQSQISIIASSPQPEFADQAIEIYSQAGGFRSAENYGRSVILPMISSFSETHILRIVEVVKGNNQIWDAAGTPSILERLYVDTRPYLESTRSAWKSLVDFLMQNDRQLKRGEAWEKTGWKDFVATLRHDSVM